MLSTSKYTQEDGCFRHARLHGRTIHCGNLLVLGIKELENVE